MEIATSSHRRAIMFLAIPITLLTIHIYIAMTLHWLVVKKHNFWVFFLLYTSALVVFVSFSTV